MILRLGIRGVLLSACVCLSAWAFAASAANAYVYWTVYGVGAATDGTTIARARLNGTGVNHSFITGASGPTTIAVDAHNLYWGNSLTNSIGRASLAGRGARIPPSSPTPLPGPAGSLPTSPSTPPISTGPMGRDTSAGPTSTVRVRSRTSSTPAQTRGHTELPSPAARCMSPRAP